MRRPRIIIPMTVVLVTFLALVPAAEAKKKKKKNVLGKPAAVEALSGPLTLSNVNDRWTGAAAQTRINLPIKKGKDGQGWSHSEWLFAEGESIKMRFSVNNREALREVLPQKNLLAGVHLICDGWTVQNPQKGRGIQVDFHFANYPAKARAEFNTDLEHLADVERYLRFNVVGVTRADERLSSATAARPAAGTSVAPSGVAPSSGATRVSAKPVGRTLDVTFAEVLPAMIGAGGEVKLVIEYLVSSGNGSEVEVSERRVLGKAAEQIASFEEVVSRAPGSYVSEQSIRIPDDAPPGFYSYQAAVSFGELSDEFSAVFEVQ